MSAYMSTRKTRSLLAYVIFNKGAGVFELPKSLISYGKKNKRDSAEKWFKTLSHLNNDALFERYGDRPYHDEYLPRFGRKHLTKEQVYKSLGNLTYQCEDSRMYKLLECLQEWEENIQDEYPDLEGGKWDL